LPGSPVVPGNYLYALDKRLFVCYIITMRTTRNLPPLPEVTWEVTFENESSVFIAARDKEHARRIIENNGLWRRTPDCEPVKHTIKKIEKV
tara:strand:- start:143 stop:415 length:273 start_codon:yes stop_codon:yes gene_type:complete